MCNLISDNNPNPARTNLIPVWAHLRLESRQRNNELKVISLFSVVAANYTFYASQ